MRRTTAAVLLMLGTALAGLPGLPAAGSTPDTPAATTTTTLVAEPGTMTAEQARTAVQQAVDLLSPQRAGARTATPAEGSRPRVDASLVLRDVALGLPLLTGRDRLQAEALLARPTDGASDPAGFGYTVRARNTCAGKVCVHWVNDTADQPPSRKWVTTSLKVMKRVWRHEVGKLGYRRPPSDGKRGPGRGRFDVYLKDFGATGIYGYCAPERRAGRGRASGYCVLDNDFSQAQYGAPPKHSLKATAAHEFFHAVQFGYDYAEDRWLLESTATWMEERFADDVNDNRQYLPSGQLGKPLSSLDVFGPDRSNQYGNWVFWEYLGKRRGVGVVKKVWQRAQPTRRGNPHSMKALRGVLGKRFVSTFSAYSAANTAPARYYPEGKAWPAAPVARSWQLGKDARKAAFDVRINHLASRSVKASPGTGLGRGRWKLRIRVDGPARRSSPVAYVTVKPRKGKVRHSRVRLNGKGNGTQVVEFRSRRTRHVTVTLVNASTRYRCGRGTGFACNGKPVDQNKRFGVTLKVIKRR